MSRFFVGQRVRIVRCGNPENNHLVGKEATVVGKREVTAYQLGYPLVGIEVRIDGLGEIRPYDGRRHAFRTSHLEPILPEGHKASEYSLSELLDRCREGVSA